MASRTRQSDIRIERDFLELLKLFNKHRVEYCIIGAFAVAFHAISRYTKDMDILVRPSLVNGTKIIKALEEFGFGSLKLVPRDFERSGRFVQLGLEPVRVDLITSIKGVTFGRVWKNRKKGPYGDESVNYIGLGDLIRSKLAANRRQDRADMEMLKRASERDRRRSH